MTCRTLCLTTVTVLVAASISLGTRTKPAQALDGTSIEELRATAELDRIRAARDAYEAERLVERAARLEMHGLDAEAEPLYARAVKLDATNPRARQGLAGTRERLGLVPGPASPLIERSGREMTARRQEFMYRFEAYLAAARDGIARGGPEGFQSARLQLDRARLLLASAAGLFPADEARSLDARVREHALAVTRAAQGRADAIRRAEQRDIERRIKEARVHDKRLAF